MRRILSARRSLGIIETEHESPNKFLIGTEALSARPRRRAEVVSTGIDEQLQGNGSDPFGSLSWVGLRVPAFVSAQRYLFMLCGFDVASGDRARIVGLRQGWTLGFRQTNPVRIVERPVTDPFFKPPLGNISWHLRRRTPGEMVQSPGNGPIQPPLQNFAFRDSQSPALLYVDATVFAAGFYVALTAYTPPNGGMPYGVGVTPEFQTFYDLKTKWRDASDWHALDIPVEGPARVQLYASVKQIPRQKPGIVLPDTYHPGSLPDEEQFLVDFPLAQIWRVAGALAVEFEDAEQFRSYEIDGRRQP